MSQLRRPTVAAVIPTKNVAAFIAGALESLRFCDEVIVVDMFSVDETRAVCESFPNVRFYQRNDYIYGNFNFGMEQTACDWIVRLDSDERLSPELQREIQDLLRDGPAADVYEAPFTSWVLGRPIRHGPAWEQRRRTTLFRRGTLRYRVRSEHEDLTAVDAGTPLRRAALRHPYVHFSMPSISKFIAKMDYYSERDFERADTGSLRVLRPLRLMWSVPRYFFHYYVLRRGYRDGYAGFAICALNAVYRLVHELKAWERKGRLREAHARAREEYDRMLRVTNQVQTVNSQQHPAGERTCHAMR
jgi:glycosyltransferase involved in cell wall biosynthesis